MRLTLGLLPFALLLVLYLVLRAGAAREVRENATYSFLFLTLGAAWLPLAWEVTAWLGIDVGDDALERNNPAACIAACGTLVGSMAIYTFANIGEGPTIWTTIGPAMLGSVAAVGLMAVFHSISGSADAITIDRDLASGVRFASLATSGGLILGRPLAGDYVSASSTLGDFFAQAWPALPLVAVATVLERRLRPSRGRPRPSAARYGLVPSFGYLAVALLYLIHLGLPSVVRATRS